MRARVCDVVCARVRLTVTISINRVNLTVAGRDPFHLGNHVTCSSGYNIKSLPQRDVREAVLAIRTPSAEFANWNLRKLDGGINSMSQHRFMCNVRYHLHRHNENIRAKLRQ